MPEVSTTSWTVKSALPVLRMSSLAARMNLPPREMAFWRASLSECSTVRSCHLLDWLISSLLSRESVPVRPPPWSALRVTLPVQDREYRGRPGTVPWGSAGGLPVVAPETVVSRSERGTGDRRVPW